ncbi:MAG: NAD(P)/FAD-dependent oxidoreductase [Ruminococcaceae bacterium]|nr:NAD(P)/FAD-dependent oxidoreductase [Oscillospiraceae bacterium]
MKVAIIGGGAAGLFLAGRAKELGAEVTVFEKNPKPGRKLMITGKGRCNICNYCDINEFLENVPTNPRFLYTALNSFSPYNTVSFFEDIGVKTKLERGNRIFPESDKAADVVDALKKYASCRFIYKKTDGLIIENGTVKGLFCGNEKYLFDKVVICTGGCSYPLTGSDGDGYKFAKQAGHSIVSPKPSLVPLETKGKNAQRMQGLSLKNVALTVTDNNSDGKKVYEDFGEMMFTHFGVTGPMILSASSHIRDISPGKYRIHIDLKPALSEKELDTRLLSDFDKYKNKNFENALGDLLPKKAIPVIIDASGIDPYKKVNSVTKEERRALIQALKDLTLDIKSTRPIAEAIITSGGVSVKEIDPKTMESKLCRNLYFAGEVIDVDAYTGGFNLQIAFSTANLAAVAVSQ